LTILWAIRTAVFYLLFLGQTFVLAVVLSLVSIFWPQRTKFGWAIGSYWGRSNLWLLRWVVGIHTDVQGRENIPPGPAIIASKHQSDWDIFAILPFSGRPAFIAKRELMQIPFFGRAARSIDAISIDRSLGGRAVPKMLEDARAALERGCRIIIFPEGTRKAPGAAPAYRQGISRMYSALGVPVIPVALNSGLFWGRNSLVMRPGVARARILPPIEPGLDEAVFFARLQEAIESESQRLLDEAKAALH
jgi:1-acyl-sn-glycerol-3-phosphate acyltransferase